MNTDDILDALNEVDDTAIKNAREPKKRGHKALWISVGAVAACLAFAFTLPAILQSRNQKLSYMQNGRECKVFGIPSQEEMIGWNWDCLTTAERFSYINYNDADYLLQRNVFEEEVTVPVAFLEKKIADVIAEGSDWRTETNYTMNCSLYEISGLDPARYLAVQYAGEENAGNYYVFTQYDATPPATLGDFITALNPSETLPFTRFEYITHNKEKDKKTTKSYGLSLEDSKVVWDMISEYATARTETDANHRSSEKRITAYASPEDASSAAVGHSRKCFSLWDDGYLSVYIEKYNYHFYLGKEAVAELLNYILSRKTNAPEDSIKTLYGVVTEIGDDYIKIDDTILMKNPEDGMEYTVYTHNMHVKRHITSKRITVGSHVKILHRDSSSDNPTKVPTAFYLEKIGFVFEKDETAEDYSSEPTPTPKIHVLE